MLIEFLREDDMDRDDVASVIEFCFSVINVHLMVFWIMLKYKLKAFLFSFLNVWLCYFYQSPLELTPTWLLWRGVVFLRSDISLWLNFLWFHATKFEIIHSASSLYHNCLLKILNLDVCSQLFCISSDWRVLGAKKLSVEKIFCLHSIKVTPKETNRTEGENEGVGQDMWISLKLC